ncbi:MAG: cytochrome c [Devosia sp.]|nr:cytochrome c [Devosia sp.]
MSIRTMTMRALAGLALAGSVAAMAQDGFAPPATPEEALAMRKALMREDGGILRSAGELSGAEAIAALEKLRDNYSHIPTLFPEGSIVGDSKALPAIWENWAAFTAIVDSGLATAEAALAAAEAGDAAAYAAALQTLGRSCGQCHQQFRG